MDDEGNGLLEIDGKSYEIPPGSVAGLHIEDILRRLGQELASLCRPKKP